MAEPAERPSTLRERLLSARRRRFVGRESEKTLLRSELLDPRGSLILLHLYGPGGVGKTALLGEFAALALEHGFSPLPLDARNLDPSPEGFLLALRMHLGLGANASPLEHLARERPTLLLLDTYEALTPLDGWLREVFLPQLPETARVVLAGRNPLAAPWHADPGWRSLFRSLSLRNLRPEESRDFLARRGIPEAQHGAVLEFTHGHPLALSLVADVLEGKQGLGFRPDSNPDVVRSLLERFVQQVPSPLHRAALEASALVRVTTEPLLGAALELDDAHEYFEWLRGLSFVESGPQGLFPHDLAREALDADLRWRNPDRYAELHRRVRGYYTKKLLESRGLEQQRALIDDVYLHRHNPMVKPFLEWGEFGSVYGEGGRPQDHAAVLEMVERHEGPQSAQVARRWLELQPQGLTVYRGQGHEPAGFMLRLELHAAAEADLEADPATRAALAYARRQAPPRPGEAMILFRFWMSREHYQQVSPVQSLIFIHAVQQYFAHPKLSWSFFPCASPEFWSPALGYMDIRRAPEADWELDGKRYGQFAHDWRALPVGAWLELLGQRELDPQFGPEQEPERAVPVVVLSEPEFREAVKHALRDFTRPAALAHNPLLRSRLLRERTPEPVPADLQALLREAAHGLEANPKDHKLYRALQRTYLEPAATQELAAELLDLPFSTYRRHLTQGIERVAEWLWQRELYGVV